MTSAREVNVLKAVSVVVIFVVCVLGGLVPLYAKAIRNNVNGLSIANCFAAGIFLFMALVHILPEATESLVDHYGKKWMDKYRMSYIVAAVGYGVLLVVQRVVFVNQGCPHSIGAEHGHSHGDGHAHSHDGDASSHHPRHYDSLTTLHRHGRGTREEPLRIHCNREQQVTRPEDSHVTTREQALTNTESTEKCQLVASLLHQASNEGQVVAESVEDAGSNCSHGSLCDTRTSTRNANRYVVAAVEQQIETEHGHHHHLTSYILMLALGIHGFSEGMALGLQQKAKDTTLLLIAITAHKWAESLSLGVSFQKTTIPRVRQLLLIIVFSFSSPVGIGLGWVLRAVLPSVASGYLMALCCGTFLYIGCTEVVSEEFSGKERQWVRALALFVGGATIMLVTIYLDS